MGNEALSPAQKFEYRFLKQQVDNLEQEQYSNSKRPNTERDLFQARKDLKEFVRKLRENGIQIWTTIRALPTLPQKWRD